MDLKHIKHREARDCQRERAPMSFKQSSYCLIVSFDPFSIHSLSLSLSLSLSEKNSMLRLCHEHAFAAS